MDISLIGEKTPWSCAASILNLSMASRASGILIGGELLELIILHLLMKIIFVGYRINRLPCIFANIQHDLW